MDLLDFRTAYVAFQTRTEPPSTIAGRLRVPEPPGGLPAPVPGVLICHGSDGLDGRGEFHGEALNRAGLATLEIDMWAARGVVRGPAARPASVPESLPDAFAALAFMARQPEIDPSRIAIIGFSWGGVISMLTATRRYADVLAEPGTAFVAHAAFYPALWTYNRAPGHEFADLTGAPVLVQAGGADAYDDPEVCENFLASLDPVTRERVSLIVHPGATHAFDRNRPAKVINDPYAHKGAGGPVLFEHNPVAAGAAREAVVTFLLAAFARADGRA
jgi:dienelactone hydrolase